MALRLPFVLDSWQEEVLQAEGNLCICSGRQVGKSQVVAVKAALYAAEHGKKHILIVSVTEDQAELMMQKILALLVDNYPKLIAKGRNRPTRHLVKLTNGSQILTKAVGQYGTGIRGYTVDVLIGDEAAYMPEGVWPAATPMLLTTGGQIWLLSTPNAMQGYFYEAYTNPGMGFKTFHVNSEEVAAARPEPLRSAMQAHLAREKARMTSLQYAQQYLAQFLEEMGQFFPDELISRSMVLQRGSSSVNSRDFTESPTSFVPAGDFFLGVDVARLGGDETTFEILERRGKVFYHRENITRKYWLTTDTIDKILELDQAYQFSRIFIDDGGLGVAVFDQLLQEEQVRRKVEAINNSRRSLDVEESPRRKKLMKEDLYFNLKRMMERGEVQLLSDEDVRLSLKSIMIEHSERSGEVRIYGRYSHIAEGLIRAAWAVRSIHLNIYFEVI